jgi:hypothetical protein
MEAQEERRYSSYSFTTSAVDGVSGQRHSPAALYPGKRPWHPLYRTLGGPQSRSGQRGWRKNLLPCRGSNLDRPVVQSVVRPRLNFHHIKLKIQVSCKRIFITGYSQI